jgi:hypothetical protein
MSKGTIVTATNASSIRQIPRKQFSADNLMARGGILTKDGSRTGKGRKTAPCLRTESIRRGTSLWSDEKRQGATAVLREIPFHNLFINECFHHLRPLQHRHFQFTASRCFP